MTRDELVHLKAKAFDRMRLCHSVFIGNKPPHQEHAFELMGHAAFYTALCAELGEPIPELPSRLRIIVASLLTSLRDVSAKEWCKPLDDDFFDCVVKAELLLRYLSDGSQKGGDL